MASIFDAVRAHDQTALNEYLKSGGDVNARDSNGMTALILAADAGCDSIVRFLLEHKASPNLTDRWGQTALMLAAGRNITSCAKLLLAGGAALDIRATNGLTALRYATDNGAIEVARVLADAGARPKRNNGKSGQRKGGVSDGSIETDRVLK